MNKPHRIAMISAKELDKRFTYHPPKDGDPQVYEEMRNAGKALAFKVLANTKESREQSIAISKIEEAIMWANAARARHGDPDTDESSPG